MQLIDLLLTTTDLVAFSQHQTIGPAGPDQGPDQVTTALCVTDTHPHTHTCLCAPRKFARAVMLAMMSAFRSLGRGDICLHNFRLHANQQAVHTSPYVN